MLRRQQYSVDLGEVSYVAPPKKKCVSKQERLQQVKKEACGVGVLKPYDVDEMGTTIFKIKGNMLDNNEKLQNSYKAHGCDPMRPSCIKMRTCRAKTSTLHDGTENVSHDIVGLGVKEDGNMGNLYNTYRDVTIVDTDALISNIRKGIAPIQDQVTKDAEYKARLYGSSYGALDGVPTGYTCIKCPKKEGLCLKYPPVCKIPDPNNPETGIGSDLMESKENLLNVFQARRVVPEGVAITSRDADFRLPQGEREEEAEALTLMTEVPEDPTLTELVTDRQRRAMEALSPLSQMTMDEALSSEAGRSDATTVKQGETVGQSILSGRKKRAKPAEMKAEKEQEIIDHGRELGNNERQAKRAGDPYPIKTGEYARGGAKSLYPPPSPKKGKGKGKGKDKEL